jgi:hypothetical protein
VTDEMIDSLESRTDLTETRTGYRPGFDPIKTARIFLWRDLLESRRFFDFVEYLLHVGSVDH